MESKTIGFNEFNRVIQSENDEYNFALVITLRAFSLFVCRMALAPFEIMKWGVVLWPNLCHMVDIVQLVASNHWRVGNVFDKPKAGIV